MALVKPLRIAVSQSFARRNFPMAAAQTPSGNPQRTLTLAWATVWHAAVWCNSVAKPLAAPPNTSSGKALDYLVQQRKNVATSSFALTSRGFAIRHMTPHGCLILWRTVLHALVVPSLTAAISSIARHLTAQIQLGMDFGRTDHIQKVLVIALHIVVTSCSVAKLPVTTPNSDLRLQARGKEVLQRFVANQSFARHVVASAAQLAQDYTCQGASLGIVSPEAFGSTDGECCAERKCEDYTCSSATKWEKKPSVEESEDGGQQPRMGFSDEECCVPKFCKNFLCSSTKWKSRHWPEDDKTLGGSFEECCDALMCSNYTCTTDYDGDGQGTMYVKKKDTNSFRWQGSSDEDCCTPLFCSQYETKFPTKWRRNTAQLGSTDAECYDPVWCSAFNGCGELKLIKDATHKQGSTVQECCEAAKKTD